MPSRRPRRHMDSSRVKIEIKGITVGAFTAVDGIESKTEVIDGMDAIGRDNCDRNDMWGSKSPGRTTCSNIVLKRGYVNTDELWMWYKRVVDGEVELRSGSIIICGHDGSEISRYNFFKAWPCRYKILVPDAVNKKNLVEEIEIVVGKIERDKPFPH